MGTCCEDQNLGYGALMIYLHRRWSPRVDENKIGIRWILSMISHVMSSWQGGTWEPPFSVMLGGVLRYLVVSSYHSKRKLLWWFMVEIRRGIGPSGIFYLFICILAGIFFQNISSWNYDSRTMILTNSLLYCKPCNTVLVENYCTSLAHFEVFPQKVLFWPVKNSNERLLTCWNFNYSTFNITKFLVLGMQNSSYAAFMVMYLECWFHTCKKKQKRPYWGCSEKHRKIMSNCTAQEYD